jgi:glycosyltransferase involved in cell wall biosynthesis
MKIAWFSPFPPLKSGISEYSELIVYELKRYARVDLWIETTPLARFLQDFRVYNYRAHPEVLPLLKTYDAVIYNMGNDAEFHSGIYDALKLYPGIVILHDYVLHHFFAGYYLDKKHNPAGYVQEVYRQYGAEVAALAEKCLKEGKVLWEKEEVFHYPLSKSVLERASGVVVHSEFVKGLLEEELNQKRELSIKKINHPVFPLPHQHLNKSKKDLELPEDKTILAALGFVTPVKRLERVLKAIAEDRSLRESVVVLVIGESVSPEYRLEEYIRRFGLFSQVKMLGYLPIDEAYAYLNCADICLNLRYPTMGETSGSLVRIMSLGKTTLVTNVGWYAELPDDCVVKIDPANEEAELKVWLKRLISDFALREKMGLAAKHYVQKEHSLEKFVQELLAFAQEISARNANIYFHVLDKITDALIEIGPASELVIPRLSAELSWLYASGREE